MLTSVEGVGMRVLIIEDDVLVAKSISIVLKNIGAVVDQVDTGEEGVGLAQRYDYDILIVDLILSDIEGFEIIRRLRKARIETPILILSGMSRPESRVRGLTIGADDFLAKPFDAEELIARVHAVIRRNKGFSNSNIFFCGLNIDIKNKKIYFKKNEIYFTIKEYQIIELLILRKGMTISKDTFLNHLYGGIDEPEMKIIDVFICKIRKKLALAGLPPLITTAWGRGYTVRDIPSPVADIVPGSKPSGTDPDPASAVRESATA